MMNQNVDKMNKVKLFQPDGSWQFIDKRAALLLDLGKDLEEKWLKELGLIKKPTLVIMDGVDAVGKTTVVKNIIKEIENNREKVIWNKFKRRRSDNENFRVKSKKYEWMFRKECVEEINRRLVTYDDEEWIIVDKSPYSEYYYQKTPEFDRGYVTPYGNHLMEKEIFKYKEIIDSAIVIFLENDDCWKNYIKREKESNKETSYEMLEEESYRSMVESFKLYQDLYEDTKRYKQIKIKNDDESWKRVYEEILKLRGD